MKKLPKLLLMISSASFALGAVTLTIADVPPPWTVALPLGAVFLGLFLIALMLQNEMARFDQDERARLESAERFAGAAPSSTARPASGEGPPAARAGRRIIALIFPSR